MDPDALWCNICPKQPRFSDVSHLLTHVSSKAHLSHYFKLQVRSHQEPHAGHMLEQYDRWYKVNNLAKLLSDRMASKEARKNKSHGRSVPTTTTSTKRATTRKSSSAKANTVVPQNFLPDFLDPRLSQSYFDNASGLRDQPSSTGHDASRSNETVDTRTTHWPACPVVPAESPTRAGSGPWKIERESHSEDESPSVLHETPPWSDGLDAPRGQMPVSFSRSAGSDPFVDDDQTYGYLDDNEDERERVDEMARLKGVLWPGMDIFDSATEQMRRKRNQKKDGSILKMMEKTSESIEPTEMVFSPTGILRKERFISGNVDDSSPLKGETPIPKRRAVRPKRGPLSQSDPNAASRYPHDRQRAKKRFNYGRDHSLEELSRQALPLLENPGGSRPFVNNGSYYSSLVDDESDLRLTLGSFDEKPRGGFRVFADEWRPFKNGAKDQFRDGDPPSLLSQHRHQSGAAGHLQSSFTNKGYSTAAPSTSHSYMTDKENIEPILNCQGRIDPLISWHASWKKQQYEEDRYLSQYFYGDSSNHVDFGPFGGNDLSGYYSSNPLASSYQHFPLSDDKTFAAIASSASSTPKMKRAISTDSTISEMGQDDVGRLYLGGCSD
ncbi:hypothetical protein DTO271G3_578 [Paecilomyces variotii]|nr:hypothetical protein DTO271G3_578 [Paecilomyces variotii]